MYLLQSWKNKVYLGLMLVLVSTPAIASSETWGQNLDLTIPSLETPSTWRLDSKAKQEIMMGFECCYHNSLLESVQREASLKSIQFKSKVNLSELPFSHRDYQKELYYFWAINALDVWTTNRGLKHPNVYEMNPIVGEDPHLDRLILFKLLWGNLILHTHEPEHIIIPNALITLAGINNIDGMNDVGILSL